MIIKDIGGINEHGEVNWRISEMIPLGDKEALELNPLIFQLNPLIFQVKNIK